MRKILVLLTAAITLIGCAEPTMGLKTDKEQVVWKNNLLEFSTPRGAYDGNSELNPGFKVKVTYSDGHYINMPIDTLGLGYGASCPKGATGFYKPENGIDKAEILDLTENRIVIRIGYKSWDIQDVPVTLDKQITLYKDIPFMSVIDYYTGKFDTLNVVAGLTTAGVGEVKELKNGFSIEYPYGVTAVIIMPQADEKIIDNDFKQAVTGRKVTDNEPLRYYVGISDKGEEYLLEKIANIL